MRNSEGGAGREEKVEEEQGVEEEEADVIV